MEKILIVCLAVLLSSCGHKAQEPENQSPNDTTNLKVNRSDSDNWVKIREGDYVNRKNGVHIRFVDTVLHRPDEKVEVPSQNDTTKPHAGASF